MKKTIATVFFAVCAVVLYGQPGKGNPGAPPSSVPIDGGISLLIAAGAALGGKKAFDAYKKKGEEQ